MPKKRSPILEKVSSFMKISIFLAKIRRPITLNLIFFKKSSLKARKFKLLRHYNNGFIQEYQFCPSNTPSILRRFDDNNEERKRKGFRSMLVMCLCLGGFRDQPRNEDCFSSSMEGFPAIEDEVVSFEGEELEMEMGGLSEDVYNCSSIDERAEQFIANFYEQMRMQRNESNTLLLL